MEADVSCDGGVVIWRQMCHVMVVWSLRDLYEVVHHNWEG